MATRAVMTDTGVGKRAVGGWSVLVLSVLLVVWALVLLYSTMAFWPPAAGQDGLLPTTSALEFAGVKMTITREQNLLLLVAVLGGLGAILHVLRSFFKYAGERGLVWSWIPSYFLIPFVGAVIAVITYVVLRAGLVGGTGSEEGNTWGFAAIASLVGLFSAQATSKLKDIFETILTPTKAGGESVADDKAVADVKAAAAVSDLDPKEGPVGTAVNITGTGLESITTVRFGGGADSKATWIQEELVLQTKVPEGAKTGKLKVTVDGVDIESSAEFKVT